jgi:hypothetical protein
MTTIELGTLIFTFFSLVISLIAIIVTVALTTKSDSISMEANKKAEESNNIANRALEIALFEHGGNVLPDLTAIIIPYDKPNEEIYLQIINRSRGKAIISQVSFDNDNIIIEEPFPLKVKFPIVLLYNNDVYFKLRLKISDEDRAKILATEEFHGYNATSLGQYIFTVIRDSILNVNFSDSIGTKYSIRLRYKSSEKDGILRGVPVQIKD